MKLSDALELSATKIRAPVVFGASLLIAGTCIWLHSSVWSTVITALGTIVGLVGIWIALEIFKLGNEFTRRLQKLAEDVHRLTLTSAKLTHLTELRRNYWSSANDDHAQIYWHFAWRFESYDSLGLSLADGGYLRIRVIGSNNPPLEYELERTKIPIYTVDVYEVQRTEAFTCGRAYCTHGNRRLYISREANEFELLPPQQTFTIEGLGDFEAGAVGNAPMCYRRLKDLRDLDEAGATVE